MRKAEMTREIEVSDEHGQQFMIYEYTKYLGTDTLNTPTGLRSYRVGNTTYHAKRINDSEFEIVAIGKKLRAVS